MKMNTAKRIGLIVSAFLILILSCGCSKKSTKVVINTKRYDDMKYNDDVLSSGVVCENGNFTLEWDDRYKQVTFKEKATGAVYSTSPIETRSVTKDENGEQINYNPLVKSPIAIYYYSAKTLDEFTADAYTEAISDGGIYTEEIENGIRVTYDLYALEIAVSVDYTISEKCFNISVDPTLISDDGENYVTGVAVAPFLCSLPNDSTDSYIFIPDGSGALIKPITVDPIGKQGSARVYGEDLNIDKFDLPSYIQTFKMPVFGVKNGSSAITGIITSGAEQAYINWDVGAQNKRFSSVYPFFRIRGYNLVESPKGFSRANIELKIFDENISKTKLNISYYTLNGDKANYNGMAEIFRNYLFENGSLAISETEEPTAYFRILGGIRQKKFTFGIPHTVLKPLTTVSQANEITKYMTENIDGNIVVNLVGFGDYGIDTGTVGGGFKINRSLGSNKEIKNYAEFCKNNGISLFMNFDITGFSKTGGGYSLNSDSAKLPNGQTLFQYNFDNVTRKKSSGRYTLLSRSLLDKAAEKATESAKKYNFSGVSFDSLSFGAYSDYSAYETGLCAGFEKQASEIFQKAEKDMLVLGSSANSYSAGVSDYITEVPLGSSKYDIEYCDIPFYEIVYKGYVPMFGESVNLSADGTASFLKLMETGISPAYTLIYNYDNTMAVADYPVLFSSRFNGNEKKITDTVNTISSDIKRLNGAKIVNHSITENGLRVTQFDNGIKTLVNYSDNALYFDGIEVPAVSYRVMG